MAAEFISPYICHWPHSIPDLIWFQLMCLTDLEFDYMNPYDSASRINMVILPEYFVQALLCLTFLITGHWFFFLLSLPYLYYNITLYLQRRHLVDVTEIYNQLNREKQRRLFKLGFLVILLVLCIFWFLWTIGEAFE
ncbi:protein cornichon homolog 1 isoform X2 [Hevea brasiliensis]|uniref:protein cornichon homolog 1 isoform X2 n=1 Tax=Hevea brasiliensis TaxID=3981 RepID=UPI0025DD5CD3|nr:protein cornichon homolog 1 isoform X2 [Hevea brasiliensis]